MWGSVIVVVLMTLECVVCVYVCVYVCVFEYVWGQV